MILILKQYNFLGEPMIVDHRIDVILGVDGDNHDLGLKEDGQDLEIHLR